MSVRPALHALPARFDVVVIGGGISGAGVFQEAVRRGYRSLLVERGDFASGTSSASSKLVHGGLRYLKSGQWRLTLESVRERDALLRLRPGLVERQPFLMPLYRGMKPGRAVMRAGLAIYDAMGGHWSARGLDAREVLALEPQVRSEGLCGGVCYDDAATDDARLALRTIFDAVDAGGVALNYVRAEQVLSANGRARGVGLRDVLTDVCREVEAGIVVNAAGAGADRLDGAPAGAPLLRPLRGSHLIFPLAALPVRRAVSWLHPCDRRPVFVYPWQGIALYGTTDVDHDAQSPLRMSAAEAEYLMEGLVHQFPALSLGLDRALASCAGVRPVIAGGKDDPSAESRESALWQAPGYIGLSGGKLTTFRAAAQQVMRLATQEIRSVQLPAAHKPSVLSVAVDDDCARYGASGAAWLADEAPLADCVAIGATPYRWAHLRWAARHEQVVHLDDLLLRRTRLGLLLPQGGEAILDRIGVLCRDELGWGLAQWEAELARYRALWRRDHAVRP